ncbi:ABC transporter substrate-binding protein [Acidisoma cellulosilytica]|uniref:ABC transporter substrate-binding protein n=1 Tax=Acidisoma cellulosilyticum TaxID=2802395 RepID=A0A963Z0X4_9PROT|nr:ABC transporter substrate-binding protein [Acidisoma cellulosilyticum]MCB8880675.1 ABC transporter substrate-binding protein [Acidisoma cellulosilyticum]
MTMTRRTVIGGALTMGAMTALPHARARAAGNKQLTIGVCSDFSGTYSDVGGKTSVACVHQAIEDWGAAAKGYDIKVIQGDHQNKPDIGAGLARQWFDNGVDMLIDVPNSAVGLAIAAVAGEKNKTYINTNSATSLLTGKKCNASTIHWSYDTYMLSHSTGGAMVAQGGKSWFFITANYAFGQLLRDQTSAVIKAAGGKVVGDVDYPFPQTTDFSSFLLQAQSSGAQVLGLANAGKDTVNSIKQAHQFGITQSGMKIAGLLIYLNDIHGIGLEIAQGLVLTESFYWNMNDRTRAFTKRVLPKTPNNYPSMAQAGCYSGTTHFLKAVDAMGVDQAGNGPAVVAQMKKMPTDDDAFGQCSIREDGRFMCASYLFRVKKPGESAIPWDYYDLLHKTSAEDTFAPLATEGCPLVKA